MNDPNLADTWSHGNPYEHFVGRWSRQVAPRFLEWLDLPPGRRWLDVGCGTGALCATILERCAPTSVTGVEPSEGFLRTAAERLADRATLLHGSATSLPLADASVDTVVSGLVLNFVADPSAALAEMARVTAQGGTIAAYVWDYAGKMKMLRHFWDAAGALDPTAAAADEGVRFPLCHPDALERLFSEAGLRAPQVRAIDVPTRFADFEDYWQPFLGGQGPAPTYVASLSESARTTLRERLRAELPTAPDGTIPMTARAWAVQAQVTA